MTSCRFCLLVFLKKRFLVQWPFAPEPTFAENGSNDKIEMGSKNMLRLKFTLFCQPSILCYKICWECQLNLQLAVFITRHYIFCPTVVCQTAVPRINIYSYHSIDIYIYPMLVLFSWMFYEFDKDNIWQDILSLYFKMFHIFWGFNWNLSMNDANQQGGGRGAHFCYTIFNMLVKHPL